MWLSGKEKAGDTGSIPDPGRSHMLLPRGAEHLSLCATMTETVLQSPGDTTAEALEPVLSKKRSLRNGKPVYHNQRKARPATKAQHSQK